MRRSCCLGLCLAACLCIGGERAWAQDACSNNLPPVANAIVKADSEVNVAMRSAADAIKAGHIAEAMSLLDQVLSTNPAVLVSIDGVTFRPARKLVTEIARSLPERTLTEYRARAGISVKSPSVDSSADLAAWEARYRNPFANDSAEAGLRLAGLYLDEQRFQDARSVLLDVLEGGAAPRVPRAELLSRLVVACARVGDFTRAQWAWDELQKEGPAGRWPGLEAELRNAPKATPTASAPASNAWTMAYGGPSREGAPAAPCRDLAANESWAIRWALNLEPAMIRDELDYVASTNRGEWNLGRRAVVREMTDRRATPDGIVFSGNKAYLNRSFELAVADLDSGLVLQRAPHSVQNVAALRMYGSFAFGSGLDRAASLIGSRVYAVEDNPYSALRSDIQSRYKRGGNKMTGWPCGNSLATYDAATGKPLWRVGRDVSGGWRVNAIRFLGAPVMCAGRLLTSFDDDVSFGVVAFDAANGAAVWRTRLAPGSWEPALPMAPLAADGASVYVCGGNGHVSALDAFDGSVLWTSLYEQGGGSTATNAAGARRADTWEDNLVLLAGYTVVTAPADSGELLAYDRRNGAPLWKQPKPEGVDYVVGRRGMALIVAGAKAVARVDLTDGRERWRKPIRGATGRGVLRGQEVLIPCGQAIGRWRIEDGTTSGSMRAQTLGDLPLGNLYVHGDDLLVFGPERVYALTGADSAFANLAERIARQPAAEAYAERGAMLAGLGRHVEALGDLREAWKRQRGAVGEAAARTRLLECLYRAAEQDAAAADRFCAEAREVSVTEKERADAAWRTAQFLERKGDTNAALSLYAAMLTAPEAIIRCDPDWEVSARLVAARHVRLLLAKDEAGLRALLEKPAAQELERLGSQTEWTPLVDVVTLFAGTAAGREAAFKGARIAADRGDFGIAAAILQRAMALSPPTFRTEIAGELARLYERMKWPRGAVKLREDWPVLGGGAPLPDLPARADDASVSLPPWRLRWKKADASLNFMLYVPSGMLCRQSEGGQGNARLECLSLETGKPRWEKPGSGNFGPPQGGRADSAPRAVWEAGHLLPGDRGVLDLWSGTVIANDAVLNSVKTNKYVYSGLSALLSGLSVQIVACSEFTIGVDMLTGQRIWTVSDNAPAPPGQERTVVGTMLTPDGTPAMFPQTGHFLAFSLMWAEWWRRGASSHLSTLALDPMTGTVLSRRSLAADGMEREIAIWTRPAFSMRFVSRAKGRLIVQDPATGITNWMSPPDLVIAKHKILPQGSVVAQTEAGDLLLMDGANGKVMSRWQGTNFNWTYNNAATTLAAPGGDAVVVYGGDSAGSAREVVILDPSVETAVYRGTNAGQNLVMSFGPALTNHVLVLGLRSGVGSTNVELQVINGSGENVNDWCLPLPADRRKGGRSAPTSFISRDLIVVQDQGDLFAYEHDPGGGGKK